MLISLQCEPSGIVPWFDDPQFFSERGVVNLGDDGMWVVAHYTGTKPWQNQQDPERLLATLDPNQVSITVPAFVTASELFTLSGTVNKPADKLVIFFDRLPVQVSVVDGHFSRQLSLTTPSEYSITKVVDPSTGEQLAFTASSTIAVML